MAKRLDVVALQTFLVGLWVAKWGSPSGATYEYAYLFTQDGRYFFSSDGVNTIYNQRDGVVSGYQSSDSEAGTYSVKESGVLILSPSGGISYQVKLETSVREIKIGGRWYSKMR